MASSLRQRIVRHTPFFLSVVPAVVLASSVSSLESPAPAPVGRLGVAPDGTVLLDEKPFRGVGINYFDAFLRRIHTPEDTSYREGFKELASFHIPFVRFACGGFYASEWKKYRENREAWFTWLDDVVASAHANGIGLIPSVFWWYAGIPDLMGEPIDQLGNPSSKTVAFIRQYTQDLVSRYRDHPAIWAYEFGNEYNLMADLPNAMEQLPVAHPPLGTPEKRTARDVVTSAMVLEAMRAFAEAARSADPKCLLTSGHAILRPSQFHQRTKGTWGKDTREQHRQEWLYTHPDPYTLISTHLYPEAKQGYFGEACCSYLVHLQLVQEVARSVGKAVFLGEFGVGDIEQQQGQDAAQKEFYTLLHAIEASGVPLAALWVYDFAWQEETYNITTTNGRRYQLEALRDINQRLRSKMPERGTSN